MSILKEIICFIILFAPLIVEVRDDRNGDHNKKMDVFWRILIGAGASVFVWIFTGHSLFEAAFMCFAIFFLLFDYLINLVLKRPDTFTYLSKTTGTIDRIQWWVNIGPWWRFAIKMGMFITALLIYIR